MTAPLRVLTFTSLFPSEARPRHGIFVETRLQQLLRDCAVDARVIAPVPWFPLRSPVFGQYAEFAATPRHATRDGGLRVSYPRYAMVPRLGVAFQPASMARAAVADAERLITSGWRPDIIDAHYFYPDGVAAAMLSERLQIPFVVTARGSDVNVLGKRPGSAEKILWAARRAAASIAVSARLKDALVALGADAAKVVVLGNGVDVERFRPEEQSAARRRLGLGAGRLAACVGHLVAEKGQSLAIESLRHLEGLQLVVVGDGPMRDKLAALGRQLGVDARLSFLAAMPQTELRYLYSSADVLLLTSTREGWPNVVLESLACGAPVVATDVGAVGEMLTNPQVGRIVAGRDPFAFAAAIADLLGAPPSRDSARRHAAGFDWRRISKGQFDVFVRALGARSGASSVGHVPVRT